MSPLYDLGVNETDGFDWVRCAEGGFFRTAHFVVTPHFDIKNSTPRDRKTTKKKHTPKTQRLEPPCIPLQPCSGARKLGSETRKLEKTQLRPDHSQTQQRAQSFKQDHALWSNSCCYLCRGKNKPTPHPASLPVSEGMTRTEKTSFMKKDGQSRDPLIEERLHAAMLYASSVTPVQDVVGYSRLCILYISIIWRLTAAKLHHLVWHELRAQFRNSNN